jgi:hypothetical protein
MLLPSEERENVEIGKFCMIVTRVKFRVFHLKQKTNVSAWPDQITTYLAEPVSYARC